MHIVRWFEDINVQVAFAEANAWEARPVQGEKPKEKQQVAKQNLQKKSAWRRAILFGIVSVGMYTAVFTHSDSVLEYSTKGGIFALMPVAMVFAFSYVHGTFAGNLLTGLGINASKKATSKKADVQKRPTADKRPRLHA